MGGNLAFSLLALVYYSGDLVAKKVFKKEIVKRLSSGFLPVVLSLVKAGYTNVLNLYDCEISFMSMRKKLKGKELSKIIEEEAEWSAGGGHLGKFERLEVKYSLILEELNIIKEIESHIGRFIPYSENYSIKGPLMYIKDKKINHKTLVLEK